MPNITIKEINNTSASGSALNTDIAYVPLFVATTESTGAPSSETAMAPRTPVVVYNIPDFEAYFGKKPVEFMSTQNFPSIDGYVFSADAIPSDGNGMFAAGEVDPGYVMAKELINLGIPVLCERINALDGVDSTPSVDLMYRAMLGTDAVIDYTYTKDEAGDFIITVDSVRPIVKVGEPSADQTYQEFNVAQTYYRESVIGDYIFADNLVVNKFLDAPEYCSYFVLDDSGEWGISGNHFTKNISDGPFYKKLSASLNTNKDANGDPIITTWYNPVDSSDTPYVKTLDLFVASATVSGATKYNITDQEGAEFNLKAESVGGGIKYVPATGSEAVYRAVEDVGGEYFLSGTDYYPLPSSAQVYDAISVVGTDDNTVYFDDNTTLANVQNCFVYGVSDDGAIVPTVYAQYSQLDETSVNDYRYYRESEVIQDAIDSIFTNLEDVGEYNVKYITSGGYPTYEFGDNVLVSKMLAVSTKRGDCVALIDHTNNPERSLNPANPRSVYRKVKTDAMGGLFVNGTYSTMFTPYCLYSVPRCGISIQLPGSFAYLASLGNALKTNDSWVAIAGPERGKVPYFVKTCTNQRLTNAIADAYQPTDSISINPITLINPYGYVIWGNRTLNTNNDTSGSGLNAWSFLNTRNTISDIKKIVYNTAKRYTFEQNSDILWINFKAGIVPTLDRMKTAFAISKYTIVKEATTEKAKLVATITIYPIYAVENFEITLVIEDDEVSVS